MSKTRIGEAVQRRLETANIIRSSNKVKKTPKLIMTLMCKDEIDIIETHIRFHIAMGVDGIIVTDHNSTDGTREALESLKKEGLILEIIDEKRKEHLHAVFVKRMIDLAIHKYHADWIINSDADEFYFSETLDLKQQLPVTGVNVLRVFSNYFFPVENTREVFSKDAYFVKRPLQEYEWEIYGLEKNPATEYFVGKNCPKVIHNTKDYIEITDGNHFVKMKKYNEMVPEGITLYHYHTRGYEFFEKKVIKAKKAIAFNHNPDWNRGWKLYISLYQEGKLREFYDQRFGEKIFSRLLEAGVICKDPSVRNFMEYRGLKQD